MGGVGFLTALGVGVGFFCATPTPYVQLDNFLYDTPKWGIPVEMVVSFETFIETKNSCCVPRFRLTGNCYKIVNSQTSFTLCEKVEVGVGYFTSDSATLVSILYDSYFQDSKARRHSHKKFSDGSRNRYMLCYSQLTLRIYAAANGLAGGA